LAFLKIDGNVVSAGQFVNGKKFGIWQFLRKENKSKKLTEQSQEHLKICLQLFVLLHLPLN
jgi:hypothetical protein